MQSTAPEVVDLASTVYGPGSGHWLTGILVSDTDAWFFTYPEPFLARRHGVELNEDIDSSVSLIQVLMYYWNSKSLYHTEFSRVRTCRDRYVHTYICIPQVGRTGLLLSSLPSRLVQRLKYSLLTYLIFSISDNSSFWLMYDLRVYLRRLYLDVDHRLHIPHWHKLSKSAGTGQPRPVQNLQWSDKLIWSRIRDVHCGVIHPASNPKVRYLG